LQWVQGITILAPAALRTSALSQKFQLTASYSTSSGGFQLAETILPAQTNITEASTDLMHWVPINTNVGSYIDFGPTTITDPNATNYRARFYRFRVLP
jgi:hypothetical protein